MTSTPSQTQNPTFKPQWLVNTPTPNVSGPQYHLQFEEDPAATTFADASGNGRNGTCIGAGCPVSGVTGPSAHAVFFDGSNDVVKVTTSITAPANYTVSALLCPLSLSTNRAAVTATNTDPMGAWSHQIRLTADGKFAHYVYDEGAGIGRQIVAQTPVTVFGQCYCVAITAQAGALMRIYVDGVERANGHIDQPWTGVQQWWWGAASAEGFAAWVGQIDEARVFHRALNSSDIQTLCSLPTPTPTSTKTSTPTVTVTPTRTPTSTPSPTATEIEEPTPGPKFAAQILQSTPTNTTTASPTVTNTPTRTPTFTNTPTRTPTSTPTRTPTPTNTPTNTQTPTITPTGTTTPTSTPTDTGTPAATPTTGPIFSSQWLANTPTRTSTVSPTPTRTPTWTPTVTPTRTDTPTVTPTGNPKFASQWMANSPTPTPPQPCMETAQCPAGMVCAPLPE